MVKMTPNGGIWVILVFRVPFCDLGDFEDPEMQAPAGPRLAIWERPEIPIVSQLQDSF